MENDSEERFGTNNFQNSGTGECGPKPRWSLGRGLKKGNEPRASAAIKKARKKSKGKKI